MGWAGGFLEAYREANKPQQREGSKGSVSVWPPPNPGVWAISVDAAVDATGGRYGSGCVIRDHWGMVLASEIAAKSLGLSPELAEATAILRGLDLAKDLGLRRVVVHSDCLRVVNAIKVRDIPHTELGTIVEDIKVSSYTFLKATFTFIPRSCNMVAHNLAKYALLVNTEARWSGCVPPCAIRGVLNDVVSL